jgi:hypothetical protein
MDFSVTQKGRPMHIAVPAPQRVMAYVKGMAGFAILTLCLAGAIAAVMKLHFGPEAQLAATLTGAIGGAILVRYTSAEK